MNVVIDWGNTAIKTGWFEGSQLVDTKRYATVDELVDAFAAQSAAHVLVSSTSRSAEEIRVRLRGLSASCMVLTSETPVPIRKAYDTPHTLGADRVAAAVGAVTLFPQQPCLILDLGTCLTADFVDQQADFQGGLIAPGLHMRFRAMHEQTARLPLIEARSGDGWEPWPALTAKNTRSAMESGVLNGLRFELNGLIDAYRLREPNVVILLCGGDAPAFESSLKPPIFAVPELVLMGLNRILRYNVDHLQASTPGNNV